MLLFGLGLEFFVCLVWFVIHRAKDETAVQALSRINHPLLAVEGISSRC